MQECAVVILNYNGEKYLKQFLPIVIEYSQEDADIIVIDNASTDHSIAFLKANFPHIKIISLPKNIGFAGGYNEGLKEINYPYYILLNSDVEVTKDWIKPLLALIKSDATIGAVQPKIRSYHTKTKFEHAGAAGGMIDILGYPYCRGRILEVVEEDTGQYDDVSEIFWATGACMMVSREAFIKAGSFDSAFFAHMEEIDLCWRMRKVGFKSMYTYQSLVFHVGGGTLSYDSPFKVFLNFRNNLWMLSKNLPYSRLIWLIPVRAALDLLASIKFLLEGKRKQSWAVFKAYAAYLKSMRKILSLKSNRNTKGITNEIVVLKKMIKK